MLRNSAAAAAASWHSSSMLPKLLTNSCQQSTVNCLQLQPAPNMCSTQLTAAAAVIGSRNTTAVTAAVGWTWDHTHCQLQPLQLLLLVTPCAEPQAQQQQQQRTLQLHLLLLRML
jgi:hypothetical protein